MLTANVEEDNIRNGMKSSDLQSTNTSTTSLSALNRKTNSIPSHPHTLQNTPHSLLMPIPHIPLPQLKMGRRQLVSTRRCLAQ